MSDSAPSGPRVDLRRATRADRPVLEGFLRAYQRTIARFSDGVDPERGVEEVWFRFPDQLHPELILVDGEPAGIAFWMSGEYARVVGGIEGYHLNDFFVDPIWRRRGVGARAVRLLVEAHPGPWSLVVLERNGAARAFWERVLAPWSLTSGPVREDLLPLHWTVPG